MSRLSIVFAAALFCLSPLVSAGPLDPPAGPITPTYKTLQEVEPRVPVQSLPGSAVALYVISEPGSYYLTANIQGEAGKGGIAISADNVTLDLNGFAVIGVPGANHGIWGTTGSEAGTHIHNGLISDWGGGGIYGLAGPAIITDVTAQRNGSYGITAGANSIITHCTARENGGFAGIAVAYWSTITDCVSVNNTGHGFEASTGTVLRGNVARNNQGDGIRIENTCMVERNLLQSNVGAGVRATTYASPVTDNRIEDNNAVSNGTGIQVDNPGNTIIKNTASGNVTNYSVVAGNVFPPVLTPATADTNTNPFANVGF